MVKKVEMDGAPKMFKMVNAACAPPRRENGISGSGPNAAEMTNGKFPRGVKMVKRLGKMENQ